MLGESDKSALAIKRAAARRIGTTYCYDFLGLLEKKLVTQWNAHISSVPSASMPDVLFKSQELVLDGNGELMEVQRPAGSNDRGMVGWRCTLHTPEYPQGREIIVIANDCTFQSGSFGVPEDEFYYAASRLARHEVGIHPCLSLLRQPLNFAAMLGFRAAMDDQACWTSSGCENPTSCLCKECDHMYSA